MKDVLLLDALFATFWSTRCLASVKLTDVVLREFYKICEYFVAVKL